MPSVPAVLFIGLTWFFWFTVTIGPLVMGNIRHGARGTAALCFVVVTVLAAWLSWRTLKKDRKQREGAPAASEEAPMPRKMRLVLAGIFVVVAVGLLIGAAMAPVFRIRIAAFGVLFLLAAYTSLFLS